MEKGINNSQFRECLSKGKIKEFNPAKKLVPKELSSSADDLKTAEDSFNKGSYKWATIQAYYSMFHAARALIYSRGYRESSHFCLIVAVKAFFVDEGLLNINLVEAIQTAKLLRENADYENEFSKESAQSLLDKADELLKYAEGILKT